MGLVQLALERCFYQPAARPRSQRATGCWQHYGVAATTVIGILIWLLLVISVVASCLVMIDSHIRLPRMI